MTATALIATLESSHHTSSDTGQIRVDVLRPAQSRYESVPDELKGLKQWVAWKREPDPKHPGKPRKVPYNAHTGRRASSTDPATWTTFDHMMTVKGYDGIGFVLAEDDPYTFIDLDHCQNADTAKPDPWANDIVGQSANFYWEVSPSGTGLHGLGKGSWPTRGNKKGNVEVYVASRYATVTVRYHAGEQFELGDHTEALEELHKQYFNDPKPAPKISNVKGSAGGGFAGTDADLIVKAQHAKNGAKFSSLWTGNTDGYPSQSEADQALVNMLVFWCAADPERIDRLFRASGLYRGKWDEKHGDDTYGALTIAKSLSGQREYYRPSWSAGRVKAVDTPADDLESIVITARPLRDISDDALNALGKRNIPPALFVRSNRLVRCIMNEYDTPLIDMLSEHAVRGRLARVADFLRVKSGRTEDDPPTHIQCSPPLDVTRDILALGDWPFPVLEGVTSCPILRPTGELMRSPGYNPETRLFYWPPKNFKLGTIPDAPAQEDARAARDYICDEILSDFPFSQAADLANMIATLLTPVTRSAILGNVPLCLIDKPTPGSGATLLTDVVALIATGTTAPKMLIPEGRGSDDEWRKRITSTLMDGYTITVFDNVDASLSSNTLAMVLTTEFWRDRILGRSENITLPVHKTWIATGNNVRIRGDLARRSYRIRIDTQQERPWERHEFRHLELLKWVEEHRGVILAKLYTMILAYFQAGLSASENTAHGWV